MTTEETTVELGMTCADCGHPLVLTDDGDHMVLCVHCPAAPGEGATPVDAADDWLAKHPAPRFLPSSIAYFTPPKHPWVIECGGFPFLSLTAAEAYSATTHEPIYCRLATEKKAANQ